MRYWDNGLLEHRALSRYRWTARLGDAETGCTGLISQAATQWEVCNVTKILLYVHIYSKSTRTFPAQLLSLFFGRCHRPSRLAARVATRDGEAVQYISGEYIDHVAGKYKPQPATDPVSDARRTGSRNTEWAAHLGIIHKQSNDNGSLCPTLSKPEKNSLFPGV